MSNKKDLSFLKDKTLGIISSYQDNCGNATYTKQIIHDLKNYFKKTDCIELDQRMVHSSFHNEMKIHGKVKKSHVYASDVKKTSFSVPPPSGSIYFFPFPSKEFLAFDACKPFFSRHTWIRHGLASVEQMGGFS